MDKRWISLTDRTSSEYINGVKTFIEFAVQHSLRGGTIKCPCRKCCNRYFIPPNHVYDHVIVYGMQPSYTTWVFHGEHESDFIHDEDDIIDDNDDLVADGTWDMLTELNQPFMVHGWSTYSPSTSNPQDTTFQSTPLENMFQNASQPMYYGCTSSRITVLVKLLHLKTLNGWSNKYFDMLLNLLNDILPTGSNLPSSFYKAKQLIGDIGLNYEKIDACKNNCILYWKENAHLNECPTCHESIYTFNTLTDTRVPQKILRYFPLAPRLQRLSVSSHTAKDMRWHHEQRVNDGVLRHPADSEEWKRFYINFPFFANEPRNVRLGLASDGFNHFQNMSKAYSIWPVFIVPYNLPPWRCMKEPFMMLSMLIPGPNSPCNDIDVYLQPLLDELKMLWEVGVPTFDASNNEIFNMHAALLWTINDFPAYANFSSWSTKGNLACLPCNYDASFFYLTNCKKTVYVGHVGS